MKTIAFAAVLMFAAASMISAWPSMAPERAPAPTKSFEVQSITLGSDVMEVFARVGIPQALQVIGGGDHPGLIQLLYFKDEDTLAIEISDLPINRVTGIEMTGDSWNTTSPVKVGDSLDKAVAAVGTPDSIEDLTRQKQWMIDQAGSDPIMRKLIEKSSGDTAIVYSALGIYAEYDKNVRVIKSVRLFRASDVATSRSYTDSYLL